MKKFRKLIWIGIVVTMALIVGGLTSSPATAERFKMSGEITYVNMQHNTVVIEVPMGKEMFTVAGPLAGDAKVMKNGRNAELSDFQVGEKATVTFHSNPQGHVIDSLMGR